MLYVREQDNVRTLPLPIRRSRVFTFRHPGARYTRAALLCLVVAVGVVSAATVRPGDAAAASQPRVAGVAETEYALAASTATPLQRARDALAAAAARLERHRYTKALASLKALRYNLWRAHKAAVAKIGKPPTDPESDEPPGPPAVIAVANLEHRVTMVLVPFFNGLKKNWVIDPLRYTLLRTHVLRDAMLDKVIALPAAKGEDYDDGMSDTVPAYKAEVTLVTKALNEYQLNANGRNGLTNALARVSATYAKVNERWGGGE
jgi:hypothetical protein